MGKIRFFLLLMLVLDWTSINAAEIKKWTDEKGEVHYGDIIGHTYEAEVLEINDPAPEITDGEKLMRMKNDLYFDELELKHKRKQLDRIQAIAKKQKKELIEIEDQRLSLDYDRRACIKAKLKIQDIEDDLREGYSAKRGMQLDKKRRQQQRRVDTYCEQE